MANRGTHHGDYGAVPQQLTEGGTTQLAKPLQLALCARLEV